MERFCRHRRVMEKFFLIVLRATCTAAVQLTTAAGRRSLARLLLCRPSVCGLLCNGGMSVFLTWFISCLCSRECHPHRCCRIDSRSRFFSPSSISACCTVAHVIFSLCRLFLACFGLTRGAGCNSGDSGFLGLLRLTCGWCPAAGRAERDLYRVQLFHDNRSVE